MNLDEKLINILWETINTSGADPETQDSKDAIYFGVDKIKQLIEEVQTESFKKGYIDRGIEEITK